MCCDKDDVSISPIVGASQCGTGVPMWPHKIVTVIQPRLTGFSFSSEVRSRSNGTNTFRIKLRQCDKATP